MKKFLMMLNLIKRKDRQRVLCYVGEKREIHKFVILKPNNSFIKPRDNIIKSYYDNTEITSLTTFFVKSASAMVK